MCSERANAGKNFGMRGLRNRKLIISIILNSVPYYVYTLTYVAPYAHVFTLNDYIRSADQLTFEAQ